MSEECSFCGEIFEGEDCLHVHWGEEHDDELTSHQDETYRKAKKKIEEQQEAARQRHRQKVRKYGEYALFAVLFLGIGGLVAGQIQFSSGETPEGDVSFDLEGQPMLGDANASVTVVEVSDYQCGHCKRFHEQVLPRIKDEYIETGQVKLYSFNYAFLGQNSVDAAVGAECVYEESETAYREFSDRMYERQLELQQEGQEVVLDVADTVLGKSSVETCITGRKTLDAVRDDRRQGEESGVEGTPTIFVDGRQLDSYDYATVSAAIDRALD